ncbi:NAD(P)H-dependent oxidoreductase [Skermania sp. ID1734]|uniref:NAD(P)H-dependent oxidoreductase n=1 Tax=Skermania sp. ID1734 TaxID=2597516 RepID=UPI00117D6737|nr:NAD(P)H-dependent oxidoreductase [Skermania sp. ID1734]TSE00983.1 NAD(P)H-dependent oxidoreductase [Skermania sp. ID1734]
MSDSRIVVLYGSLRADAMSRRIAEAAAAAAPAGVDVVVYDGLGEVPFYNEDIDVADGLDPAAAALREAVAAADAVLLVTPEYNGTIPAVLKNAIDWLSRPFGAGALAGRHVAVISASPSPNGAAWAQADTAKAVGVARGVVHDDLGLTVGKTIEKFGAEHPREHAEFADELRAVINGLVAASRRELLPVR